METGIQKSDRTGQFSVYLSIMIAMKHLHDVVLTQKAELEEQLRHSYFRLLKR